jgi:hypothetical protein
MIDLLPAAADRRGVTPSALCALIAAVPVDDQAISHRFAAAAPTVQTADRLTGFLAAGE